MTALSIVEPTLQLGAVLPRSFTEGAFVLRIVLAAATMFALLIFEIESDFEPLS